MHKNSHNFFIKNGYIIFNLFNKNEIDLISKDIISRLKSIKLRGEKFQLNELFFRETTRPPPS